MAIEAYNNPEDYLHYQRSRPDYFQAISQALDFGVKYSKEKSDLVVADFCCGVGSNIHEFSKRVDGIARAILIDINKGFLDVAHTSGIEAQYLDIRHCDVLDVEFDPVADLVFSFYAYHHIPDDKKELYVHQIGQCLKPGGKVIVAEIYLPKDLCLKYYDKLFLEIPLQQQSSGLKKFLQQTAESDDFEFKVAKAFADHQFQKARLSLVEEVKIWPVDNAFDPSVGTWVQVYQFV